MSKILKRIFNAFNWRLNLLRQEIIDEQRLKQINGQCIVNESSKIFDCARFINNRNDKSKITIGGNCQIRGEILLARHAGEVNIGEFVFLGENSKIWSSSKVSIGNNVLISHNVNIHDFDSHPTDYLLRREQSEIMLTTGFLPEYDYGVPAKDIVIENDVWICFNAVVLKGVTIGKGAIVSASAVVTKDVEPFTVVAGNPAKVVKYLVKT